ncbi:MAG: hypothetical protein JNM07_08410 [Phycisphaerae bacterium]|nr:hypothetical protein [Phycisphaerae bacterium]
MVRLASNSTASGIASVALNLAFLGAAPAHAELLVDPFGVGSASADIWGHPASPPGPSTHSSHTTGYLPGLTLGPGLLLCDPRTYVSITSSVASTAGYLYSLDAHAFGGDTAGGSDLARYVNPISGSSRATVNISETTTPTSIHLVGDMILSDSGAAARIRLIDGFDPAEPHIIYEDLFLNPNDSSSNRIIDLTIPAPSGNAGNLFLQVDLYGSSRPPLPEPPALALLGAGAVFIRRRR